MLCTEIVSDIQNNFCTQHVLSMFCKKKSFRQRFTCIRLELKELTYSFKALHNLLSRKYLMVSIKQNFANVKGGQLKYMSYLVGYIDGKC